MKISSKNKSEHRKSKKKPLAKPKKEHVLIVAQEIKFARLLAGNEQKTRDRALKSLKKWLHNCFQRNYEFKEHDFTRIWKGLFYAVWMSDKPLVQEELCENIASILDEFPPEHLSAALIMTKVGYQVLAAEWYGLDSHRIDKFLMLVRRYLRGSLRALRRGEWAPAGCDQWAKAVTSSVLNAGPKATSMTLHVVDCLLEEVSKVSSGKIPPTSLSRILRPFITYMCTGSHHLVIASCRQLLTALLRQSDRGIEYAERTRAWQQMGCPEGGPEALELEMDTDDQEETDDNDDNEEAQGEEEKPLDPRAGHVDVILHPLPVPCEEIAEMLRRHLVKLGSKAHKRVRICLERFNKLSSDEFPLPVEAPTLDDTAPIPPPSSSASKLHAMERRLIAQSDELANRGLSRKHRKRLLAKTRAGLSIIDDVTTPSTPKPKKNGEWQVEETEPPNKKEKKQNADKENKRNKTQKQNGDASPKDKSKKIDLIKQKKENILQKKKDILQTKENIIQKKGNILQTKENVLQKKENIIHKKENISLKKQMKEKKLKKLTKTDDSKSKKVTVSSEKAIKKPLSEETAKISPENNKKLSPNKEKLPKKLAEPTKKTKTQEKVKKSPPTVVAKKVKNFQKQLSPRDKNTSMSTPKKVKFVLKNNSMQNPMDYYKSVRLSPKIPFDSSKLPSKTNLKVSTPSPINPFFKKKLRLSK